jgi:hypothetical protein
VFGIERPGKQRHGAIDHDRFLVQRKEISTPCCSHPVGTRFLRNAWLMRN